MKKQKKSSFLQTQQTTANQECLLKRSFSQRLCVSALIRSGFFLPGELKMKKQILILSVVACQVLLNLKARAEETVSTLDDQQEVAVTIYNEDLALVRDLRQVTLPKGHVSLALREVSAKIRPETALLRSLNAGNRLTILEQNFDFDLLTPGKLLEKYVGREVQ